MQDKPVITKGDFDSQNLAFWHPIQKRYVAYHRKGREGVRYQAVRVRVAMQNADRYSMRFEK